MGEATKVIQGMIDEAKRVGGELTEVRISRSMYEALVEECAGMGEPSAVLGVTIEVLPDDGQIASRLLH